VNVAKPCHVVPDLRASEKALLHLLRLNGAMSKAELARLSNMSAQGVSIIVERLLDLDLVRKGSKQRGRVGQPSTPIELNPEGAVSLGLFMRNDAAQFVVMDFTGRIVLDRLVTYDDPLSDATTQGLVDAAADIVEKADAQLWSRRIGIGVSARVSLLRSLSDLPRNRDSLLDSGTGKRLASSLSERFELPVYCVNDIRAACIAQIASDGANDAMTSLYLNVGETLGSGLILEGRLIGAENELPSSLHSLAVSGCQRASVEDFASFASLRNAVGSAGFDFQDQLDSGFGDTRIIFENWKRDAVSALADAIRAACATVPVERVFVGSCLNEADLTGFVNGLREAVKADTRAGILTPELSNCAIGLNARVLGTAMVPFFKAFGPAERTAASAGAGPMARRSAVA